MSAGTTLGFDDPAAPGVAIGASGTGWPLTGAGIPAEGATCACDELSAAIVIMLSARVAVDVPAVSITTAVSPCLARVIPVAPVSGLVE
ncbi:MAG: hypothetical protein ABIR58_07805 [Gemmatimonadaceae bacterium]